MDKITIFLDIFRKYDVYSKSSKYDVLAWYNDIITFEGLWLWLNPIFPPLFMALGNLYYAYGIVEV